MFEIIVLIILILLNALFASIEMAFVSLNDVKIEKMAKEGNKKALGIFNMLKSPSKFLATIQIGITFAGFLSSAFASDTFAEKLAPIFYKIIPSINFETWETFSIIIITILLSCLMLIFGELVPKRIAMKNCEQISFATIGFINVVAKITSPFVFMLMKITNYVSKLFGVDEHDEIIVTEEEIRMVVDQGQEKGAIKKYEKIFINNVLEFNDKKVSDIVINLDKVFKVEINTNYENMMNILANEGYKYSRFPIYEETENNIVGILYVKDILKNINSKSFTIKNIMKEPIYIKETKLMNEVFNKLQRNNLHIAIVKNDKKEIIGMVTMDDILGEIVGNIKEIHNK